MNVAFANKLVSLNAAMTFGIRVLCDGREAGRRETLGGLFLSEIYTGSSGKTSSESSSYRRVAVLPGCFGSVVIDFRRGALTIKKSPETWAFAVDSVASSAVLNNLRQASEGSGTREGPTDSDPRLQFQLRLQ